MPLPRPRISSAIVIVVASFVVLGLPDFAHGVAWPAMRADLNRGIGDLGWLIAVFTVGYLAIAFATGRLERRFGLTTIPLS